MGDFNQYLWVKNNLNEIKGSVLEIGSKFYDQRTDIDYRSLFGENEYTGIDFQEGENVDIVVDMTWDIERIRKVLNTQSYNCIICNSVLEHVDEVFVAAQNISKLLSKNGVLFVSVPFVWEEHGYPNDYWRFTKNGLKKLFSDINFSDEKSCYYSSIDRDFAPINDDVNAFMQNENMYQAYSEVQNKWKRKLIRGLQFITDSSFRNEFIRRRNGMYRLYYKKCSINLYGIKQ